MTTRPDDPLLPRPVDVAAVPADGTVRRVEASAAEREAIATAFGLLEVRRLTGEVELRRRRDRIAVDGQVEAAIVQACVVTLEPVEQAIDETFQLRLVPEGNDDAGPKPGVEIVIDAFAADPPDTYSGTTIDVGAIVLEHFALAIDPYPRAPGAAIPPEAADPEDEVPSPFAVLAGLARRRDREP